LEQKGPVLMRWKFVVFVLVAALAGGGGYYAWMKVKPAELPAGIARSNGRLEAERTDIATKFPGRIADVLVKEGDTVKKGQLLVKMDTAELEAQLREAEARTEEIRQQLEQALALRTQRQSELTLAEQEYERSRLLGKKGYTPTEKVQQRRAAMARAEAALHSAEAGIGRAKAAVSASMAGIERIRQNLSDYDLVAPRDGRIQYRLAQPGEVLGAGGRVLTLLDFNDVYMTIFLPTKDVGRLAIGAEARIVPDAAPQYVVPARVSFVASNAQFTPKYVETKNEREKLMFRVKIRLPQEILTRYSSRVKAGITGVAYVQIAPKVEWPENLAVNLPETGN